MKILISEIFQSIQWEWRNTWKPSIFVRFWWCNLHCEWCDTKYSRDSKVEKPKTKDLKEVVKTIKSLKSKHIIFTWWEPTLFQKQMKAIQQVLNWYTYELETNGSNELVEELEFNQINISPKLKSSWNGEYELNIFKSDLIKHREKSKPYVDLKFVCSNEIDTKETDECIKKIDEKYWLDLIDSVYIMPLWIDKKSQTNQFLVKYCIDNNYNYCLRQHIILFWDGKWK